MDIGEDLFNFDDDYLFFSQNIATQKEPALTSRNITDLFSVNLSCNGEDEIKKSNFCENGLVLNGELESILVENEVNLPASIELFNFSADEDFLLDDDNLNVLSNICRMNIQKLFALSSTNSNEYCSSDKSFLEIRQSITKFFFVLRSLLPELCLDNVTKSLSILRVSLGSFDSIPNFSVIHSAHGGIGNKSLSSQYHLLHGQLEWRWVNLTILLKIEKLKGNTLKESEFESELKLFIYDLITLSMSKYNKCNNSNLIFSSPFSCACVKESWYLVQQLILKLGDEVNSFWCYFNNIMNHIKEGTNLYNQYPEKSIILRTSTNFACKTFPQFSIWLLSGHVKVYGFNKTGTFEAPNSIDTQENFELLEPLIRNYLKDEQSEENMRVLLFMISELLTEWPPKSDILMILWESFNKKINSTFFIAGQNLNSLAVSSNTAIGYLEQIKLQQSPNTKLNINNSSYTMFVSILGKIVQKFTETGQKIQIQKIFGRILSKFTASKLLQLNEMGIHNIMTLFLTLAVSTDLKDISQKITDVMLQIPLDKLTHQQRQIAVTKGHIALLILYAENHINISQYVSKFLIQINLLCEKSDGNFSTVLKIVAEGMQEIFMRNENSDFENGEDLFIDSWIIKYLNCSTSAEQDRLFESLSLILEKVKVAKSISFEDDTENLSNLTSKFFRVILPYVKHNFSKNGSIWLPELAANFCILAGSGFEKSEHVPKFEDLFKFFLEMNCLSIENSMKFLAVIMNSEMISQVDKNLIIQQWIKYSVLLSGSNKDLRTLTRSVIGLPEFKSLCSSCTENSEEFLDSKEPLLTFFSDIGKKYQSSNNHEKLSLIEKLHNYFATFDKWALQYIQQYQTTQVTPTQSQPQSNKGPKLPTNHEIIMRIYTMIALVILHCSPIIYVRSKSSCFFNILMSQFILPCSVMMGKSQPSIMVAAIAKIWHVLIEGISKLDFRMDTYLSKNLTDLVVKWTPQFKTERASNSKVVAKPFISMMNLRNKEIVNFIWDKLGKSFICLQNRQPNQNACLVLTIIEEVLNDVENNEEKFLIILRNTIAPLMEHALMSEDVVPSKLIVYRILNRYMKNPNFENNTEMKQLFVVNLKTLTTKHLSYYSTFYFKFIFRIVKFHPGVVGEVLEFLNNQILRVEQLRGSGRDMSLRTNYEKLHGAVKAITDKK